MIIIYIVAMTSSISLTLTLFCLLQRMIIQLLKLLMQSVNQLCSIKNSVVANSLELNINIGR